nr:MAG TPA: hypothetical protein [Caudoviricetes sp.]
MNTQHNQSLTLNFVITQEKDVIRTGNSLTA